MDTPSSRSANGSLNNWEILFILKSARWYREIWHIPHEDAIQLASSVYFYKREHGKLFRG